MRHSIEVRLPFQDPDLVNFLIALPGKYRFNNGSSKFLLRKVAEKHLGKTISDRSKYGFADHLWNDKKIYTKLNMEEKIRNSSFFKNNVFKKDVINFILNPKNHPGLRWSAFALSQTYENIN